MVARTRMAAALAAGIGLMAVVAGGQVLAGRTPGYTVIGWLPLYNVAVGVVSVIVAAFQILRRRRHARLAAGLILAAHALVLATLLAAYRGIAAPESLTAMGVRMVVWALVLWLLGRGNPGVQKPSHWRVTLATAVACLCLGAAGYAYYVAQAREIFADRRADIQAIGGLKSGQVRRWRAERLADLSADIAEPFLSDAVVRWLARPGDAEVRAQLTAYLGRPVAAGRARAIALATPDGRQLLIARADRTALDPLEQDLVRRAAVAGAPVAGDITRAGPGHVRFLLAAPLAAGAGRPAAVLVEEADPEPVLFQVMQAWPTPSASGETMLARRDGNDVVYLNTLRHRSDPPLTVRVPMTETAVPAVHVLLTGAHEFFDGMDYRGVPTVADVRPIPDSSWVLVTKIDRAELLAELRQRGLATLLITLLAIASAAGFALVLYLDRHRTVYRNLSLAERARREALEESRATLYSIGDGVIATDEDGRVTRMNPVAEQLTGWREGEAAGRLVTEVFSIVNEDTRAQVENPVWRVLREGQVVGLANHTLLLARDGTERPIADSGAPIRVSGDAIKGTVLVFRDQTEERRAGAALRTAAESWRTTFDAMVDPVALLDADGAIRQCNLAFRQLAGAAVSLIGRQSRDVVGEMGICLPECVVDLVRQSHRRERREAAAGERTFLIVVDPILDAADAEIRGFVCAFRDVTERRRAEAERERLQDQVHQKSKMESVGRLAGGVAHDFNNMLSIILGYTELAIGDLEEAHPAHQALLQVKQAARHSADLTGQLLTYARRQPVQPVPLDLNDTVSTLVPMLRRLIGESIELHWQPAADLWTVEADASQIGRILQPGGQRARCDCRSGRGHAGHGQHRGGGRVAGRRRRGGPGRLRPAVSGRQRIGNGRGDPQAREPFFTTKDVGAGTGLGLATVYGAVRQDHGFIDLDTAPGQGTTFRIYYPRVAAAAAPARAGEAPTATQGQETVLLVEDEPAMLRLATSVLERRGYVVLAANRPNVALTIAETHKGRIHLLVTDVVMPEMNGEQLSGSIVAMRPDIKLLFMSGYPAEILAKEGRLGVDVALLQKPFSPSQLVEAVRRALDR